MVENYNNHVLDEIKSRIDRTEAEMAATLDAIQGRLSLEYLKAQAEERILDPALKEAGVIMEKANQMAKGIGEVSVQMMREDPFPLALIGLGLGWLLFKGMIGTADDLNELSQAATDTGSLPEDLYQAGLEEPGGQEYREGGSLSGSGTGGRFLRFLDENLLAVGVAALAVGAGVGLLLPRTRRKALSTKMQEERFGETARGEERFQKEALPERDRAEFESLHSLGDVQAEGPYATQREPGAEALSESM